MLCDANPDASVVPPQFTLSFISNKVDRMILPLGEGISFQSDDEKCTSSGCSKYYSSLTYLLSMPWCGITNGQTSLMYVVDTFVDANLVASNRETTGTYTYTIYHTLEKNRFSYARHLLIIFLKGNNV
ncbi:hypothetical protein GPJ56_004517 [Histomonas meleagridis]|uniref:uncharacterized protein n=1 Tax=Histomonas meleagridis TaxID=135588 RepID=UPI00355A96CC|nr:hypothetical protein GPJ56_004517 [Histomonas meleagridis]KAH0797336.1 hypothetical protein GO595_009839 [Histomonas meleagridis]